jgi:hypothetical protein
MPFGRSWVLMTIAAWGRPVKDRILLIEIEDDRAFFELTAPSRPDVQGAKSVMLGENVCGYEGGQVAVYSVDVPIAAQITRASSAEP